MPANSPQGLSDEQVEELLQALLDFRRILLSLNDRFQNRMALLEKEFAEQRSQPASARPGTASLSRPATGSLPRPGTGPLRRAGTGALASPAAAPEEVLAEVEDEIEAIAFNPEETDQFSIVDIDDEDEDF